jgi:O-antigen ligase
MSSAKLYKYELFFISFLVLIMPSLEAGKTLFWFLYLCTFVIRRYRDGNLSLVPRKPATIAISLYLLATLASTLVNWPIENGFKGFLDEFRFCTLFLCLYSASYTEKEYRQIAVLVIVGVLGGLAYGLVEFLLNFRIDFQFHSAGILTQSSIYLGIGILLNIGLVLDNKNNPRGLNNSLKIALLIQLIALVYMGSRGSMLAVAIVVALLAILNLRIRTIMAWLAGLTASVLLVTTLIQIFPDNVFSKDIINQYSVDRIKKSDNQRMLAWEVAFAKLATGEDLLWGIGPRNYTSIKDMDFIKQSEKLSQMKKYTHAHNLFLTQTIEQGIIGLLALLYFFLLVFKRIIKTWRLAPNHKPAWAWYGGVGGLSIPIIAGMFNTPFYQEHAMLAMLVMGMMFAITERVSSDTHPIPQKT